MAVSLFGIMFVIVLAILDTLIIWKTWGIMQITGWSKSTWLWFIANPIIALGGILLAVGLAFIPNADPQSMIPGIVWFVSVVGSTVSMLGFVYLFEKIFKKRFGKNS